MSGLVLFYRHKQQLEDMLHIILPGAPHKINSSSKPADNVKQAYVCNVENSKRLRYATLDSMENNHDFAMKPLDWNIAYMVNR